MCNKQKWMTDPRGSRSKTSLTSNFNSTARQSPKIGSTLLNYPARHPFTWLQPFSHSAQSMTTSPSRLPELFAVRTISFHAPTQLALIIFSTSARPSSRNLMSRSAGRLSSRGFLCFLLSATLNLSRCDFVSVFVLLLLRSMLFCTGILFAPVCQPQGVPHTSLQCSGPRAPLIWDAI